jgi:hypothetical protein
MYHVQEGGGKLPFGPTHNAKFRITAFLGSKALEQYKALQKSLGLSTDHEPHITIHQIDVNMSHPDAEKYFNKQKSKLIGDIIKSYKINFIDTSYILTLIPQVKSMSIFYAFQYNFDETNIKNFKKDFNRHFKVDLQGNRPIITKRNVVEKKNPSQSLLFHILQRKGNYLYAVPDYYFGYENARYKWGPHVSFHKKVDINENSEVQLTQKIIDRNLLPDNILRFNSSDFSILRISLDQGPKKILFDVQFPINLLPKLNFGARLINISEQIYSNKINCGKFLAQIKNFEDYLGFRNLKQILLRYCSTKSKIGPTGQGQIFVPWQSQQKPSVQKQQGMHTALYNFIESGFIMHGNEMNLATAWENELSLRRYRDIHGEFNKNTLRNAGWNETEIGRLPVPVHMLWKNTDVNLALQPTHRLREPMRKFMKYVLEQQ